MRDILFRGKRLDTGKWVDGYLFVIAKGTKYEQTYILGELDYREDVYDIWKVAEEVDSKTVGQFTGLIDRNEKKIFEGDIVRCCGEIRSVVYDTEYAEFEFDEKDPVNYPEGLCLSSDHNDCEVIGNIHDNPDLMKR